MIRQFKDNGIHVIELDGPADLLNAEHETPDPVNAWIPAQWRKYINTRLDYSGGTTDYIDSLVKHGWPEGMARIETMANTLREKLVPPVSFRRQQRWLEDGDECSWEREQAGHDTIWRTSKRESRRGPVTVELLVQWGGNNTLTPEQLFWSGAALIVLSSLLEEAGYRVGASLVHIGIQTRAMIVKVPVKEPHMPLDIASLTPIVAHAGVFRWHGLLIHGLIPWRTDTSFGYSTGWNAAKDAATLKQGIRVNVTYSESAARAEIQRVLDIVQQPHHQEVQP